MVNCVIIRHAWVDHWKSWKGENDDRGYYDEGYLARTMMHLRLHIIMKKFFFSRSMVGVKYHLMRACGYMLAFMLTSNMKRKRKCSTHKCTVHQIMLYYCAIKQRIFWWWSLLISKTHSYTMRSSHKVLWKYMKGRTRRQASIVNFSLLSRKR